MSFLFDVHLVPRRRALRRGGAVQRRRRPRRHGWPRASPRRVTTSHGCRRLAGAPLRALARARQRRRHRALRRQPGAALERARRHRHAARSLRALGVSASPSSASRASSAVSSTRVRRYHAPSISRRPLTSCATTRGAPTPTRARKTAHASATMAPTCGGGLGQPSTASLARPCARSTTTERTGVEADRPEVADARHQLIGRRRRQERAPHRRDRGRHGRARHLAQQAQRRRIAEARLERASASSHVRQRNPAVVDVRRAQKGVLRQLLRDSRHGRRALAIAQIAQRRAYQPPRDRRIRLSVTCAPRASSRAP